MDGNPVICAYEISGNGEGHVLEGENIAKKVKADELAWVHLEADNPATREWLETNVSYLDPFILNALLAGETRPRATEVKDGLLVILRGVNLNDQAEPEDMISIRIWVDQHRIISTRKRKLKAVSDIRERLSNGTGPKNTGDFLSMLSARLFERMEPVISELDDRTDSIEEAIIESPDTSNRGEIIDIRKKAIILRRYISPQRDMLFQLRSSELSWLDSTHRRHITESLDRVTRYVEDLDAIRERAQIVKEELNSIIADHMNKNMYILSVIAAIFLPLGFLTGLLGINVGGMPGAENDIAFWIVCLMCGGVAILIAAIFRYMKWI